MLTCEERISRLPDEQQQIVNCLAIADGRPLSDGELAELLGCAAACSATFIRAMAALVRLGAICEQPCCDRRGPRRWLLGPGWQMPPGPWEAPLVLGPGGEYRHGFVPRLARG